jgi:hypothetical protein
MRNPRCRRPSARPVAPELAAILAAQVLAVIHGAPIIQVERPRRGLPSAPPESDAFATADAHAPARAQREEGT